MKSVPKVRFREFKDEWVIKTLGDVSENTMYGLNSAAIDYDGTHKYIRITDINEVTRDYTPNPLTSPSGELDDSFKVNDGDILFTRTGASVGKCYLYKKEDGNLYFAGFLIRFNIKEANPYFVYAQTFKTSYDKWVKVMSMRSGQPGINAEEYKSFSFAAPSLPEQQKIASFLSAVDEKIQQLTRKKEFLEQYKKGVMQQLFSGKLRFKDENGKPYPKWEEKKLGDVAVVNMGQSPDSKSYNNHSIGLLLIQGNADIKGRVTSPRQWTSEPTKTCEIGDLILTVRAPVGSISKSLHKACIGRGVCSIKNNHTSNIEYLYQFLLDFEDKWKKIEQGSTFTAVSGDDIKSVKIKLPSLEEQQKIASFLTALDAKIESVATQIAHTQTFKKGLLQQMFV